MRKSAGKQVSIRVRGEEIGVGTVKVRRREQSELRRLLGEPATAEITVTFQVAMTDHGWQIVDDLNNVPRVYPSVSFVDLEGK